MYTTPIKYDLTLEPIAHYGKELNISIFTKFSIIKSEHQVKINIDEDLTDIFKSDSVIVFKLKVPQYSFMYIILI